MATFSYNLYSTVSEDQSRLLQDHLDLAGPLLAGFFGIDLSSAPELQVHLLQSEYEMKQFLAEQGWEISKLDSFGGGYWNSPSGPALTTFVKKVPHHINCATLQHELSHFFENGCYGPGMPPWLSEGLASYVEDGLIVGGELHLGWRNSLRIARLKHALQTQQLLPLPIFLATPKSDLDQWVRLDQAQMALFYDQSWGLMQFLLEHEPNGFTIEKYCAALESEGNPAAAFFSMLGGMDLATFDDGWRAWVQATEPGPVSVAAERLVHIGQWIAILAEHNRLLPFNALEKLRQLGGDFEIKIYRVGIGRVNMSDPKIYNYPPDSLDGDDRPFELLPPERDDLLHRVRASGLRDLRGGSVTLAWDPNRPIDPILELRYELGDWEV